MKTIHLILVLFSFHFCVSAQVDSVKKYSFQHGGNMGTYFSVGSHGGCLFIDYTIEKGKSLISIGPIFNRNLYAAYDHGIRRTNEGFNLHGLHCSYLIFPNGRNNTFNLFFQLDLAYFNNKIDAIPEDFYFHNNLTRLKEVMIESTISYGFRINFLRHFYFNNSIGLGFGHSNREYNYETGPNRISKSKGLSGLWKMGFGFNI